MIANIMTLIPIVFLFFVILYHIIKNAVRNGIIEAMKILDNKPQNKDNESENIE